MPYTPNAFQLFVLDGAVWLCPATASRSPVNSLIRAGNWFAGMAKRALIRLSNVGASPDMRVSANRSTNTPFETLPPTNSLENTVCTDGLSNSFVIVSSQGQIWRHDDSGWTLVQRAEG